MKKYLSAIFLIIVCFYSTLTAAGRKVLVDSVKILTNNVAVDFSIEGLIDDKITEGLQKGRTLTLEYKIQLWQKSSGVIGHLHAERLVRMKVNYDFWEEKFVIYRPDETRMTSSIETVREKCSEIRNLKMCNLNECKSEDKFALHVEVLIRPLSVENYQDIKNWLSGEVKDISFKKFSNPAQQEKGFKNRLLRVFMAITGFGDRVISGKSETFRIIDKEIIWQ